MNLFKKETGAYAASLVVLDRPGRLIGLFGHNSGAEQFIQIHDATSLPADTAVPAHIFKAAAGDNFYVALPGTGLPLENGIVVCNSSTGPTKTIGAADCWFTAVYAEEA